MWKYCVVCVYHWFFSNSHCPWLTSIFFNFSKKITILSNGCVTIDDDIFSQRVGPKVTFNLQPVVIPDVRKPQLEEVVGEPWRFQVKRPVETVQKDDGSVVQKEIPSTNAETHAAHANDPLDAVPITHNDRRSSNDEKQLATCSQIDQHFSRHNPVDAHLNTYTQVWFYFVIQVSVPIGPFVALSSCSRKKRKTSICSFFRVTTKYSIYQPFSFVFQLRN